MSRLICIAELEKVLKKYGEPVTRRQSRGLLELMDKDQNGKVDVDGR